jgi:hypothetical protein
MTFKDSHFNEDGMSLDMMEMAEIILVPESRQGSGFTLVQSDLSFDLLISEAKQMPQL